MEVTVKTRTTRTSFDGQTLLTVFRGTPGVVTGVSVVNPTSDHPQPGITVAWSAAVIQDKAGDDFEAVSTWEEADVAADTLEFLSVDTDASAS